MKLKPLSNESLLTQTHGQSGCTLVALGNTCSSFIHIIDYTSQTASLTGFQGLFWVPGFANNVTLRCNRAHHSVSLEFCGLQRRFPLRLVSVTQINLRRVLRVWNNSFSLDFLWCVFVRAASFRGSETFSWGVLGLVVVCRSWTFRPMTRES